MKAFLAYSLDSDIRYKGTSGGVGSSLLKYLFEHRVIQTSISYEFNRKKIEYVPKIIHSFDEYKIVGSIYHDINLLGFIKENLAQIKGGFACFCLPCQTNSIRRVIEQTNQQCFLLGLTCSSQQQKAATYFLLEKLKIKAEDVRYLQYRGNGWPSGIQIELQSGQKIQIPNNDSVWTQIFHSRLFILPRCFMCENTLNSESDISMADPWLKSLQDKIGGGKTIIMVNSEAGHALWSIAFEYVCEYEVVKEIDAVESQISTIKRKMFYQEHPFRRKCLMKLNRSSTYKKAVMKHPVLFWFHNILKTILEIEK